MARKKELTRDEIFMKEAIRQAKKAEKIMEVPIGCVIVYQDKIIARGYNKRNSKKTTLAHAEIIAIAKAGKVINDWRLEDCICSDASGGISGFGRICTFGRRQ